MLNLSEVLETNKMIQDENLDVRTITMGVSLLDCADGSMERCCGKVYDKTEKRLGLAELWEFKTGQRQDMEFLKMWVKLYNRVADVEGADILMNPAVRTRFSEDCMAICCTREIYQFIEANLDKVKDIIRDYAGNRKIIYSNIKQ